MESLVFVGGSVAYITRPKKAGLGHFAPKWCKGIVPRVLLYAGKFERLFKSDNDDDDDDEKSEESSNNEENEESERTDQL